MESASGMKFWRWKNSQKKIRRLKSVHYTDEIRNRDHCSSQLSYRDDFESLCVTIIGSRVYLPLQKMNTYEGAKLINDSEELQVKYE